MTTIKNRTIDVENMTCSGCGQQIVEELGKTEGIHEVHIDSQNGSIEVTYDLLRIRLKDIEEKLKALGNPVRNNFYNRIKDHILHFTEENEKDTLTAPDMPCCSYSDEALESNKYEHK